MAAVITIGAQASLIDAVRAGDSPTVRALLAKKADVNAAAADGARMVSRERPVATRVARRRELRGTHPS